MEQEHYSTMQRHDSCHMFNCGTRMLGSCHWQAAQHALVHATCPQGLGKGCGSDDIIDLQYHLAHLRIIKCTA